MLPRLLLPGMLCLLVGCAGPSISIDASLGQLEAAVEADPNDFAAHYNLGAKHLSLKQYVQAEAHFAEAVAINPAFSLGHFARYCTAYAGDPDLQDAALEEEPDSVYTARIDAADAHLVRAMSFYPFFDWRLSTVLLGRPPGSATLEGALIQYFTQGFRDFAMGRYVEAEEGLTRTVDLLPTFLQTYVVRGLARAQQARFDAARADFAFVLASIEEVRKEQVLPITLHTADLHYLIAHTYLAEGQTRQAEQSLRTALEEQFGFAMAHVQLALIHRARRDFDAALRALDAARLAAGEDPMVALERGVVLMQLQRFEEAATAFAQAAELAPRYALPLYNEAAALEEAGRIEEAQARYRAFLERASPIRDADLVAGARVKLGETE